MGNRLMVTVLGILTAVSLAAATAKAADSPQGMETTSDSAEVLKANYQSTKYLCQKYCNGCWYTECYYYCYEDAMDWYNRQPPGARVIAQK